MWWGKIGHCFVPWHFPVYIEPSASLLLIITNLLEYIFFSFLLTNYFTNYFWLIMTDWPIAQWLSYLRVVVPSYILYGIPRGDDGKLFRLEVWYSIHNYIHRRYVWIYYDYRRTISCKRTASCRRTTSQIDETAAEKQIVLDSKGN